MEKEEIARNEQFLLFRQCVQKTCPAGLVWERLNKNTYFIAVSKVNTEQVYTVIGNTAKSSRRYVKTSVHLQDS